MFYFSQDKQHHWPTRIICQPISYNQPAVAAILDNEDVIMPANV